MALVHDRALVLRRFPFSESSLVTRVLTRDHGRVHLLARGAYRPRSRYFAVLDLFDTLELSWSEAARRELAELRGGELVQRRRGLTRSLDRYRHGVSMLELCDLGSQPGQADPALFELLSRGLDRLADETVDPAWTLVVFELGFLQNHGLSPALVRCAACGGEARPTRESSSQPHAGLPARVAFSAGAGGRLCSGCAVAARADGRRVGTMPVDVLEKADDLCRTSFAESSRIDLDPDQRSLLVRVRDFVERFLDTHLETRPRTHREFLAAPNRNARS